MPPSRLSKRPWLRWATSTVRIQVHLFAAAAQLAQTRALFVDIDRDGGASLSDVAAALLDKQPELRGLVTISRWAVDHQFAPLDTVINERQEIALIPPVSGG